jgi:transcriptional regulator with XRE-family HTH domain
MVKWRIMVIMSDIPPAGGPPLTLGWRLRMALEWAGIDVNDMAEHLQVSRSTVSRWVHDRGMAPRTPFLTAWATRCGVPLGWLVDGTKEHDAQTDIRESDLVPRNNPSYPQELCVA